MAQVKNSIFSETSKKNKDGIVNIPIDIGKIKKNFKKKVSLQSFQPAV